SPSPSPARGEGSNDVLIAYSPHLFDDPMVYFFQPIILYCEVLFRAHSSPDMRNQEAYDFSVLRGC
ncbi:MAG: hypothetical protein ABW124_01665, partial [Candidatus Thiodiazotropha sp. 6PLUC9]